MILILLFVIVLGGFIYYLQIREDYVSVDSKILDPLSSSSQTEVEQDRRLISSEYIDSFSIEQIEQSNNDFYPASSRLTPQYSVDRYIITYSSQDTNREMIQIKGQLFLPKPNSSEEFPLYVFGQGTTGLGDHCAPSKENPSVSNWGNYRAHMLAYASQGYIVVFPDYAGFNDPDRIHHYFNAQLESNVLIDGTRATLEYLKQSDKVKPKDAVFYAGYSQGGHAAFAVKDNAQQYAPEIPIKGVIGYGATTDMIALLKENPTLAPYVFYAYEDLYGSDKVNPSSYLHQNHLPTFRDDVISICIGDIYKKYGYNARSIYSDDFHSALFSDRLEEEYPDFYHVLAENNSGLKSNSIPALILQGSTDPIVTVTSQKRFLSRACSNNARITYIEYPGVHHYQTRQVGIRDSIEWMKSIIDNKIPPSDCSNI